MGRHRLWAVGISVLHVNNFPADAKKKPMGSTLGVNGRPAVALCVDKSQPAWLLFMLAHELGHLHHRHVPENGALLNETVHENVPDAEEEQAGRYAIELLTGNAATCLQVGGRWPKADRLPQLARELGRRNQVDPRSRRPELRPHRGRRVLGGGERGAQAAVPGRRRNRDDRRAAGRQLGLGEDARGQ